MRVLLLEDDYLAASGLAAEIEALGAEVVGPFRSTEEAVEKVRDATAAILDVKIPNETSLSLADYLYNLQTPFLFYTEVPEGIPDRFGGVKTFGKPTPVRVLLDNLQRQENRNISVEPDIDVVQMVPLLRHHARQLMSDIDGADRLVEATLIEAIRAQPDRSNGPLDDWLIGLLDATYRAHHREMMS